MECEFKVGDRVERISAPCLSNSYNGMYVGDTDEVVEIDNASLTLAKFGDGHSLFVFKLVNRPIHPHDAIIRAWLDGSEVQAKPNGFCVWEDVFPCTHRLNGTPFVRGYTYRIKPKQDNSQEISKIKEEMRVLADRLEEIENGG